MRLIKGLIMAIGMIGILVIIALVIGYYLFSLTPWIQAKVMPVAVSAEAAKSFDQKLNLLETEIAAAIDARENKQVSLTITEGEINSKLVQSLAEGELPLNRILINFGDGYFLVYSIVDIPGFAAKTGAIGQIQVESGKPKVVIEDFDLGKLPLPKSANQRVEQLLNIMISLNLADMALEVSDIQIKNHQLIVTGSAKIAK